jgi:hypothetical protein
VRASATLYASRHFRPRRRARQLPRARRGGYFPRRGKLVELQASDRGRWRTFALARSDRRGNFHGATASTPTAGVHRYALRARVRFDRAYSYVLGSSHRNGDHSGLSAADVSETGAGGSSET